MSTFSPVTDARAPYLSIVVTTRNDDHGGDPLQRFQAFLDSLAAQCRRFSLDAELIVVEWNPPGDRPRLADAMRWPLDGPLAIRVIEVPSEYHRRLKGSQSLPLFQMIGKNVGIRRSRGRFILCTNIDIIFSHELFAFIASRQLDSNRAYRVVRYDVTPGFPQNADVDVLMRYCQTHQMRGHYPNGSFPVEADGSPALFENDIVGPAAGIRLGRGWHMREAARLPQPFRWVSDRAEIIVLEPSDAPRRLDVAVEPNRYAPGVHPVIAAMTEDGAVLERFVVTEPATIGVPVPPGLAKRRVWLTLENASEHDAIQRPAYENRAQLRYVATGLKWTVEPVPSFATVAPAETVLAEASPDGWQRALEEVPVVERRADGVRIRTLPSEFSYGLYYRPVKATRDGVHHVRLRYSVVQGEIILGPLSHDELWWRDHQMTRGRHGSDATIDLAVALKEGEEIRLVVYNNHPDGDASSEAIVRQLLLSDGLEVQPGSRRLHTRGLALRAWRRLAPEPLQRAVKATISRILLPIIEWQAGQSLAEQVYERLQIERRLWKKEALALVKGSEDLQEKVLALSPLTEVASVHEFLRRVHPQSLHPNACGDFQLAARRHWFELRGYAEFEMYSMNIDGLFTYMAHYGGAPEQRLEPPLCIYHMEHAVGSGWTPEGETQLRTRMEQWNVAWLDWQTVALWASYMEWLQRPFVFNPDNWGLADDQLGEIELTLPRNA